MRGVSFKPKGAENFSSGDVKVYGGIYAATAEDFAKELGTDVDTFISKVHASDVEPLTAVGDEDKPDRYSLSFTRDEYRKLQEFFGVENPV
ncbi:hypothetical protein [Salisaeta longa]|uniref:hypothetical protein n=1 Tax=Salisaeta longa TaxID=503170 RepID=UPI0003B58491|nr:hypothetical protein [Salisaeta longa]